MIRLVGTVVLVLMMSVVGFAQDDRKELFEDPEGKYTLTLPPGWIGVVSKDGLNRVQRQRARFSPDSSFHGGGGDEAGGFRQAR